MIFEIILNHFKNSIPISPAIIRNKLESPEYDFYNKVFHKKHPSYLNDLTNMVRDLKKKYPKNTEKEIVCNVMRSKDKEFSQQFKWTSCYIYYST